MNCRECDTKMFRVPRSPENDEDVINPYWMGKADLANKLLGNLEIDWDKHPRSVVSLQRVRKYE